jgi:hypothetical protein
LAVGEPGMRDDSAVAGHSGQVDPEGRVEQALGAHQEPDRITTGGASTEALYCKLTDAMPAERRADGDAILDGHLIEIKKTSGKAVNLNQVRPWKYLPLVVYRADHDEWYVISAHRIVRAASTKKAQHCANPFECVSSA